MEKRFVSIKDACNRYSLGRSKMRQFAQEVNGVSKIGRRVLIDTVKVDAAIIENENLKTKASNMASC